jgi:hypothetical protein
LVTRATGGQAQEEGEQGEISYHTADSAEVPTDFKPGDYVARGKLAILVANLAMRAAEGHQPTARNKDDAP